MTLMELLPMIIYMLLIVLLIILIIAFIKVIKILDKTDNLITNVEEKVNTFNPIFRLLDLTSSKITNGITSLIESIINLIKKFSKKKEEEDYE